MSQVPPAFASMGLGQHGLGGGRPQGRFAPAGRRPAAVLDRHPRPAPFGSQAGTKKRPRSAEPRNMTSSRAKRLSPMTEPVANHYAAQEGVTYVPGPKCYLCARLNPYRAINGEHVPRYLAEFEYRFNRRYDLAAMLPRRCWASVRTTPMSYRLLKLAEVYA
jgi:hypothetical protein